MTQRKRASLTDVCCATANQVASRVGDEVVILDLDKSTYFGLNPVGAHIWDLLQAPTPLTGVLAAVVAEFNVDEETARVDLLSLVEELLDKGLLELRAVTR